MNVTFEYDPQKTFAQSIDIEDIGECAIRATTKNFEDYYIVIQTVMGKSSILTFGPIIADVEEIPEYFSLTYKKIDYKEKTICLEITKLLTDAKKAVNQVEQIEISDALAAIPTSDKFIPL